MFVINMQRYESVNDATISEVTINGQHECWMLEDVVRPAGEKVYGKTAIPAGCYEVVITRSPRFGIDLPLLRDVPGFEGVRIHPGNTAADTEGCLLPGRGHTINTVTASRDAAAQLQRKIAAALADGDTVWINIAPANPDHPQPE